MDEQELLNMLREAFKEEAVERLASLSNSLLQLEQVPQAELAASEALEVAFREAHSLKGAARAVSLLDIETLCQQLESVLAQIKRGELTLQIHHFDVLHECVALMEQFMSDFGSDDDASCSGQVTALVEKLTAIAGAGDAEQVPAAAAEATAAQVPTVEAETDSDAEVAPEIEVETVPTMPEEEKETAAKQAPAATVPPPATAAAPEKLAESKATPAPNQKSADPMLKVASSRLDEVMRKAEGMIALKQAGSQRGLETLRLCDRFPRWKKHWYKTEQHLRAQKRRLDSLSAQECRATMELLFDYLDQAQQQFKTIETDLVDYSGRIAQDSRVVNAMVDELLDDVMAIIMVPFANAAATFPRMVRDIARSQGKKVDLHISGEDVELDKRILEKLASPLTHLLRNAIDHGIEPPEQRERLGKESSARVKMALNRLKSGKVEISIADDGSGIDAQRLREKAVTQGIMTREQAQQLSNDDAVALIFHSGMSTSAILTEISGRGLGMAIVKDEVERLGGHVHVETTLGQGTCFRLHIPVSLSVFHGILIKLSGHNFVLPTTAVERVMKIARDSIKTVKNQAVVVVDGKNLALLELANLLSIPGKAIAPGDTLHIVVVRNSRQRIGFIVDNVDGEYELLVKGLGHHLQGLRFFSGASLLADGSIVPIIDPGDLLNAVNSGTSFALHSTEVESKKTILAADDSITSRMLIKNILEASGYNVVSAIDGADAFAKLGAADFDLVVSDVEMPNMDGFELTARIRATDSVSDIPVILVTSLESATDKEKGVVAGANAYIVKRSFDQTNLLETIERLI